MTSPGGVKTETAGPSLPGPTRPDGDRRSTLRQYVLGSSTLYLALALLALVVVFSALAPDAFGSAYNLRSVATNASVLLIVAIGATFVIGSAGIDLSIGSVLVFSGIVSVKVMHWAGGDWQAVLLGLVAAVVSGVCWGALNGFLITKARVPALIATLGTLGMAFGLAQVMTDGTDLGGVPPEFVRTVGLGRLFGVVPWLVVIAAVVTLVAAGALQYTRFGRYTLAIGSNPEASRRAGIKVDRHLIKVYTLAGALAGFAGFLNLARFSSTTIAGHGTDNLQVITAVVLGGTSLFGGLATILGTVIGVFIPAVLQNGFVILGVQPFWQEVAVGVAVVVAVYVDQLKRRARDRA